MNTSAKHCPMCNSENEDTATVCVNCGALLEEKPTRLITPPKTGQSAPLVATAESIIDMAAIPDEGVGICVLGEFKPYYVHIYKELIIGRGADATLESVLDLTELNAVNLGVSRRHAMIRRTGSRYEVIDLSSRNGTWLNSERLLPNKSYPFMSGSKIRIGQMSLVVMYRTNQAVSRQS